MVSYVDKYKIRNGHDVLEISDRDFVGIIEKASFKKGVNIINYQIFMNIKKILIL